MAEHNLRGPETGQPGEPTTQAEALAVSAGLLGAESRHAPRWHHALLQALNPGRLFRRRDNTFFLRTGHQLLEKKYLAQATLAFHNAASLDADDPRPYMGLAQVHLQRGTQGNLRAAVHFLEEAAKRDPFEPEIYLLQMRACVRRGDGAGARSARNRYRVAYLLRTEPDNAVVHNNMAVLLLRMGRVEAAVQHFHHALRINPRYDLPMRNLGVMYYNMAREERDGQRRNELMQRAMRKVEKALKVAPTVSSLLVYAMLLIVLGRDEEAFEACEQASQLGPMNKEVYLMRRTVLERLHRHDEAQVEYQKFRVLTQGSGPRRIARPLPHGA